MPIVIVYRRLHQGALTQSSLNGLDAYLKIPHILISGSYRIAPGPSVGNKIRF